MLKTLTKVSVVTRTRDRALLLERAIKSVHNQTMRDFVHVIINDGGDPAPVDSLVEKYADLIDGRFKVIHNDKSSGMEAASNKAVKSVDSEYVAIHDDDDTWHPEFLEQTTKKLEDTGAAGVVVRTGKVTEEIISSEHRVKQLKIERWMPDLKVINLYRQCIDNQMTPITFIYKRSVYDELGGYDEALPVLGDWDFGIRFLQKYDVEYLDPGFALANYHHRKPTGSLSDNSFGEGQQKHRYWSNKLMNKYLRAELADGRLGVGYIMSKLKYDQSNLATMVRRVLPGFVTNRLKRKIQN